jgi:hypothetical protein
MLDGRRDDVVALAQTRERDSGDGEVVGLAAARREHGPFGVAPSSAATSRRARATAPAAVAPSSCPLEGFPKSRSRYGRITASTSGGDRRRGVVVQVDQLRGRCGFVARMVEPIAPYLAAFRRVSVNRERA